MGEDDEDAPEAVGGELAARADSSGQSTGNLRPFPKGTSGNPGGRNSEREALRKWTMQTYGRDAIEAIAKLAKSARSDFVKLDALKWLAEQSIGKAAQALKLEDDQGNPMRVGIIVLPGERSDDDGE
jgi:hypothetical protein